MLHLLSRLYERDARSPDYRGTLRVALALIATSLGVLLLLSRLPFQAVHTQEGIIEPGQLQLVHSEADGAIRDNQLELGRRYEKGEPVLTVASSSGTEHVYTAACQCVIARSELLRRAAGPVRAGELIAEFVDTSRPQVRFPVKSQWREALALGGRVHVLDEQGTSRQGAIERIYPHRRERLEVEVVASLPAEAALSPGSQVTVRFEAPAVPLWRFFVESLGK